MLVSSTFKYHEPVKEEPAPVSSSQRKKTSSSSSTSSSSAKWDKILNDYEKAVNKYTKAYKKAMDGDLTALLNYMDLLDDVDDIAEKLECVFRRNVGQVVR